MRDVSAAMLAEKQCEVVKTEAEVVAALDNSCLMQIDGGLHRAGSPVRTMHLAEILASTEETTKETTAATGTSAGASLEPAR